MIGKDKGEKQVEKEIDRFFTSMTCIKKEYIGCERCMDFVKCKQTELPVYKIHLPPMLIQACENYNIEEGDSIWICDTRAGGCGRGFNVNPDNSLLCKNCKKKKEEE